MCVGAVEYCLRSAVDVVHSTFAGEGCASSAVRTNLLRSVARAPLMGMANTKGGSHAMGYCDQYWTTLNISLLVNVLLDQVLRCYVT